MGLWSNDALERAGKGCRWRAPPNADVRQHMAWIDECPEGR
jgi:hypothetical protein